MLLPQNNRTGTASGTILALLQNKGSRVSIPFAFDLYWRTPLRTLKNLPTFSKLKIGQEENLFGRSTHDGRNDFYPHRLGRLAVFIAPIKGIGQNLLRLQIPLGHRLQ